MPQRIFRPSHVSVPSVPLPRCRGVIPQQPSSCITVGSEDIRVQQVRQTAAQLDGVTWEVPGKSETVVVVPQCPSSVGEHHDEIKLYGIQYNYIVHSGYDLHFHLKRNGQSLRTEFLFWIFETFSAWQNQPFMV